MHGGAVRDGLAEHRGAETRQPGRIDLQEIAGILTLARFSGRPIVPVAVVTSRHLRFNSWDRACLGLPFGRGAVVFGEPISVPREVEPDEFEAIRQRLEAEMNRVHDRAYTLVGRPDRVGARWREAAA